ncbi:flagellar hook-length control protein FliK [Liquorilactobacillus nagelii]|uniref:flagellar hook-length control protein FliK n=1 Tax=Liquorilactobacillus nagelii TaxID=82688 RepID=UPI001CCC71FA|nr:flagellar hook-length control protein FliK [Liquorilactobacillus nagelii]ULQ48752.1 flagellar hook-length control protein FliK [Liquorilactobacillus nagelii]
MNTGLGKLTKVTDNQSAGQNKKIKCDKARFDQTLNQLQTAPQLATSNLLHNQQANNSSSAGKQISADDVVTSGLKKLSNLVTIQSVTDSTEQNKMTNSSVVNVNRLAEVPSTLNGIGKKQTNDSSTSFQLPTSVKGNAQPITDMQETISSSTISTSQPTTSPINNNVAAKQTADLTATTTVKGNAQPVATMQKLISSSTISTSQPTTSPIINNNAAAKQTADLTATTTVKGNAQPVATMQKLISSSTISTGQPTTSPIINNSVAAKQTADLTANTTQPTTVKGNAQPVATVQEPLSRSTVVTDQPTTSPIVSNSVAAKQMADLTTNTTQPTTVKESAEPVATVQEPLSRSTVVTDQPTTSPIVSNSVAAKQAADLTANTTQPTTVKESAESVATVQEPLSPPTISTSQPITSPIINNSVAAKQTVNLMANNTQPTTVKESAEPVTALQAAKIMDSVDTKQKEVATDPALELVGSDISQQENTHSLTLEKVISTSLVSQNLSNNFNTIDKSVESKDTTINMGIAGKVVTSKTDSKSLNLLTNTIATANSFVGNNNPLMDTTGATKQSFVWNTTNSAGQSQLVDNLAKEVSTMNIPGSKTVTIKLSPENLGNVEITMKTAQSQVSLAVKVQNTAAKELLGSVMDKLEQVLQNQPYSTDGSSGLKNAIPVNQPNLATAANTFFNFNSSQQQFAHQQPQHNFVGTSSKFANDTKKQTAEVQQHDLRKSTISILV